MRSANFHSVVPGSMVVELQHIKNVIRNGMIQGVGDGWAEAALKTLDELAVDKFTEAVEAGMIEAETEGDFIQELLDNWKQTFNDDDEVFAFVDGIKCTLAKLGGLKQMRHAKTLRQIEQTIDLLVKAANNYYSPERFDLNAHAAKVWAGESNDNERIPDVGDSTITYGQARRLQERQNDLRG